MKEQPETLLIEIGVEEMPASYIEPAAGEFARLVEGFLTEKNIRRGELSYYHSPRRLAVAVAETSPRADDKMEEYVGPAVAVGRGPDGAFKAPAIGFAQKIGVAPQHLTVKKTPRGEYFCAVVKIAGEKTDKILAAELPGIIARIKFPKTMMWEETKFRFARPIRNILALHGAKTVNFRVADVKSGKTTFGLGPGFSKKVAVVKAGDYLRCLKNACVLADHGERKAHLSKAIAAAAKNAGCELIPDEDLFDEVNSLIEHPVAVVGRFDKKYLELPPEILVTCMKKKQKFFAMRKDGRLAESFVAVKNGVSAGIGEIVSGYEKVLAARLEDALFFYRNDLKKKPGELAAKLSGIVFHEKLGDMAAKTKRVAALAVSLGERLGAAAQTLADIKRGAELAKCDLSSEIVFEYPELAGEAGSIYARAAQESETVAAIIKEHYLPSSSDGTIPSRAESAAVAIADKADTLAADFSVGIIPSGSEDPYGLRRAGAGILKIIIEKNLRLPLNGIFSEALDAVVGARTDRVEFMRATLRQINDFLKVRLETIAAEKGFAVDEIRSAMAGGFDDVPDFFSRLEALAAVKKEKSFDAIVISLKRAANILRQARKSSGELRAAKADASIFVEDEEKKLDEALTRLETAFEKFSSQKDYLGALRLLAGLSEPLENFFNKVMVMCPDEKLRGNRLALLARISDLYRPIADFSEIKTG